MIAEPQTPRNRHNRNASFDGRYCPPVVLDANLKEFARTKRRSGNTLRCELKFNAAPQVARGRIVRQIL